MADVFISYSRRDKAFVQVLHDALVASKYKAWIDWQDIAPTAEWWQEILNGIQSAHTFIFVISPDSVASKYCLDELSHALEHNKRIIPILRRSAETPKSLSHIQWLPFREADPFGPAFERLVAAINTDLEYNKAHTRLENRATEWAQKNRDGSLLLQGSELEAAERWLIQSTGQEPEATKLQKEYISAGRKASSKLQRIVIGSLLTALAATGSLAVFAFGQYRDAQTETLRAEEATRLAEDRLAGQKAATELAEQRLAEAEAAQKREAEQTKIAQANEKAAEESATEARKALAFADEQRQRAEAGEAEAQKQTVLALVVQKTFGRLMMRI